MPTPSLAVAAQSVPAHHAGVPGLLTHERLRAARAIVGASMQKTPALVWPALEAELQVKVVVKHENHTPTGAFKVRGGLVFIQELLERQPKTAGIVSATRGNHGQSLAFAASRHALKTIIVVPENNSVEKNEAMRAFGAEVIVEGADFESAKRAAMRIAEERNFVFVPSFAEPLVAGVATYAAELFEDHADLDTVYVPIGLGSGICGLIETRDLLGLSTRIVGVVSEHADGYAQSLEAGKPVAAGDLKTFADGMAVRVPSSDAFAIIARGVDRIVRVSDASIAEAVRLYFRAIHATAEGAGAASLAALMDERERMKGRKVGVILSGQNIDTPMFAHLLCGATPIVG